MSNEIISNPDHGDAIGYVEGKPVLASPYLLNFFDDIRQKLNQFLLGPQIVAPVYTVATLPSPVPSSGLIHVSNETGGPVLAYADGTNWRRISDGAVVS